MTIARSKKGLQKPRGFHNHWDIGQELKHQEKESLKQHEAAKRAGRDTPTIEVFSSNDEMTNDIGYVVTKKAKELWGDDGKASSLKSKRATLIREINSLMADNAALPRIFANNPIYLELQETKNNSAIKTHTSEVEAIEQTLRALKAERTTAQEQEWQPLYA